MLRSWSKRPWKRYVSPVYLVSSTFTDISANWIQTAIYALTTFSLIPNRTWD